ncbi:MAG: glycosyltransferase family 4 protein [Candidatus Omnitrophica bacterium]|nr:glycosyltransferase family 4 protein [Candidatus Omnitrophota bacterium]
MNGGNRVLILTPFFRPNIGGVESYLDDLCENLRVNDYKVYVVTYQPLTARIKAQKIEKKENLEIYRFSWFGYNLFHKLEPYPLLEFLYLTPYFFICTFLFMLKKGKDIDVIHAQGLNAAFVAKFIAGIFRKRSIISTCAVYNFKKKSLFAKVVKWTLKGFDKILPLANFSKAELIDIGLPENKMDTYYLWVDQNKYIPKDKEQIKERLSLKGEFIVLFAGRFIKLKGADIILDIARTIQKPIKFVFIGDEGPLLESIEKNARENKNVMLVKGIRGRELIPYFQAADIFVIPSQYDEAFGKVIIEALSCGTPVIGAKRGAIPDILDKSVGRVVVPDAKNIKKEIEYFYDNRDELAKLTVNCREYAQKNFSIANIESIKKHYHG